VIQGSEHFLRQEAGMSKRRSCALTQPVDTHTYLIEWEGSPRRIRLMDVAPESATEASGRRPTNFGRQTLSWLRSEVLGEAREAEVELPAESVVSNSGCLLGHLFIRGANICVRMVREGWSPCFEKYGHPSSYCEELEDAERWAIREGLGIWGGAHAETYWKRKRWWLLRAGQVERCRHAAAMGEDILDARLDYDEIVKRAAVNAPSVIFADATNLFPLADGASLVQLGNPSRPLCAFFPLSMRIFARYLARHHIGAGKQNYLYFNGPLSMEGDQPQILVEIPNVVATYPPRDLQ
jgi:endonuclease YncB( thermonuclease family)